MSDTQAQISVLDFPECVRVRKEMYLPDMNYMIYEIVDNGVDEGAAGYATVISVSIDKDGIITIGDNGRGIPVSKHKDPRYKGLTQAEVAYTVLHAGGKFGKDDGYKTATGGLHGVGASCVNALAEWLELTVCCDHKVYSCRFEKGIIKTNMHQTSTYDEDDISGTIVMFKPDMTIWKEEFIDYNVVVKRLKQLAYLNPGITFNIDIDTVDHNGNEIKIQESYSKPEGIVSYISDSIGNKETLLAINGSQKTIDKIEITFAFTYLNKYSEEITTFVNNINTSDGGDHLIGFRNGFAKVINQYAIDNKMIKETSKFDISDVLEGISAIISIRVPQPKFEGQSKSKIKMPEVRTAVKTFVEEYLSEYLDMNPQIAKTIINKAIIAQRARQNAAKAREAARKGKEINDAGKPSKFADCRCKDPEKCEVWLVEGDSAAGSVKAARDSYFQAVYGVFGKMLNVLKCSYNDVIKSVKIQELLKVLKCGFGKDFNIEKLKFHKIIIASDADECTSALTGNGYVKMCVNCGESLKS